MLSEKKCRIRPQVLSWSSKRPRPPRHQPVGISNRPSGDTVQGFVVGHRSLSAIERLQICFTWPEQVVRHTPSGVTILHCHTKTSLRAASLTRLAERPHSWPLEIAVPLGRPPIAPLNTGLTLNRDFVGPLPMRGQPSVHLVRGMRVINHLLQSSDRVRFGRRLRLLDCVRPPTRGQALTIEPRPLCWC